MENLNYNQELIKTCKYKPEKGKGQIPSLVMIVVDNYKEVDRYSKLLKQENIVKDIELAYVTSLYKCDIKEKLNKQILENCKNCLFAEIKEVRPVKIFICGALAGEAFGFSRKIAKSRLSPILSNGMSIQATYGYKEIIKNTKKDLIHHIRCDFRRNLSGGIKYNINPVIVTNNNMSDCLSKISNAEKFVFDIETSSLEISKNNKIRSLAIAIDNTEDVYFFNFDLVDLKILKPLFSSSKIKICHNAKFDVKLLSLYFDILDPVYDIIPLVHIVEEKRDSYSLKSIAMDLGFNPWDISLEEKQSGNIEKLIDYNCRDAWISLYVFNYYLKQINKSKKLKIYKYISNPLSSKVILELESNGFRVDVNKLNILEKETLKLQQDIKNKIDSLPNVIKYNEYLSKKKSVFNPNSPTQVGDLLYNFCKYKSPVKSTSDKVLKTLKSKEAKYILKYREISHLLNTYIEPFKKMGIISRIHSEYLIHGTPTGRLSSINPNAQNIQPVIRSCIVPDSGNIFVDIDASQLEVRMYALVSNDKKVIDLINNNIDIHTWACQKILKKEEVTSENRKKAKTIVFGLIYDMSIKRLSSELKVSMETAKKLYGAFQNLFPGIKLFRDKIEDEIRTKLKVSTIFGRERKYNNLKLMPDLFYTYRRSACNYVIQSPASDLVQLFVVNLHNEIKKSGFAYKPVAFVHDSILVEIEENKVEEFFNFVIKSCDTTFNMLENTFGLDLKIPFILSSKVGYNWDKMEKVRDFNIGS